MTQLNWNELLQAADSSGGGDYTPLPDGVYELKVIESASTMSSTGKVMFKVKTEVQSGPHSRRLVWDNVVISPENPKAMGMFFSQMGALGLGKDFFTQQPSSEQIASAMSNRVFRGQVGTRTWNSQDRNEITRYMPITADSVSVAPAPSPVASPAGVATPPPAPAPAPSSVGVAAPPPPPF